MLIQALTLIVVVPDKDKPPIYGLSGSLPVEQAYIILFDILQQRARQQGKEEMNSKPQGKGARASQHAVVKPEGGSSG